MTFESTPPSGLFQNTNLGPAFGITVLKEGEGVVRARRGGASGSAFEVFKC
jgi:hypothetical protein